jgi:glutamate-1-semialdehyde 2,1-aminomutase
MVAVCRAQAIEKADRMAALLREQLNEVLERHEVAGFAYGESSVFHVYFEQCGSTIAAAGDHLDLRTNDPVKLKGMPTTLLTEYARHLRHHGMDIMSGTGGVVSAVHEERDICVATAAFESTVMALLDLGLVHRLR